MSAREVALALDYLPIMNANRAKGPRRIVSSEVTAWTPVSVPLKSARVALVTSAAVRLASQPEFVPPEDTSYRAVPIDAPDLELHIDHRSPVGADARKDLEVVAPRAALTELVRQGLIGSVAPLFFSFVGGTEMHLEVQEQLAPALAAELRAVGADLAALVPY